MPTKISRNTGRSVTSDLDRIKMQEGYFLWLCRKIAPLHLIKKRSNVLTTLFGKTFYSIFPNDENRLSDGKKLREEYYEESRVHIPDDIECTMLEMLVALAHRMDYILYDKASGDQTGKRFWEMVYNLGLKLDREDGLDGEQQQYANEIIIETFLERKYEYNGGGEVSGIFPLKNPTKDQRKVELWYQMMFYIEENYN